MEKRRIEVFEEIVPISEEAQLQILQQDEFDLHPCGHWPLSSWRAEQTGIYHQPPRVYRGERALNSFLKALSTTGDIRPTIHKNPLTPEVIRRLRSRRACRGWLARRNQTSANCLLHFHSLLGSKRPWKSEFTNKSFRLTKTPSTGEEYFEVERETRSCASTEKQPKRSGRLRRQNIRVPWLHVARCPLPLLSHLNPAVSFRNLSLGLNSSLRNNKFGTPYFPLITSRLKIWWKY